MTIDEFRAIAPMFASEDVTRPSFHTPFRYKDYMFVTDGRIALACRFYGFSFGGIAETTNARQKDIGERIIRNHIEATEAKIDSGKYCGYGMCSITEAVVAAFANVEPEMMYLRSKILDDDDPEADCLPNSVRYVHEAFTAVILANPARSMIAGYYASLIAGLMKYQGPVEAYADRNDPHAMLYFRGKNWCCQLMPRIVEKRGSNFMWDFYGGCAISDASTGDLVWGRDEDRCPDIDALRAGGHNETVTT